MRRNELLTEALRLEQMLKDTEASVSVGDLEEGQRYCIRAQYLYFSTPVGMSSCSECHLIPQSSKNQPAALNRIPLNQTCFCGSLVHRLLLSCVFPQAQQFKHRSSCLWPCWSWFCWCHSQPTCSSIVWTESKSGCDLLVRSPNP